MLHDPGQHPEVLYGAAIALGIVILLTPAVGGMARLLGVVDQPDGQAAQPAPDPAAGRSGAPTSLDQFVDRGIGDAEGVAAALGVGRLRAPELALLVAGRQRLREDVDRHVEVEIVHALWYCAGSTVRTRMSMPTLSRPIA